jgi:cyclopropane-fatty-acyl-phospholipid synthase
LEIFEPWDFSVYDVENLRLHYAKTLEHWLDRFERCAPEISRKFDPTFVRAWRLYLAGSLVAFRVGTMQLFQVTFAGSECQRIPWTREHLYEAQRSQAQGTKWMHTMS